MGPIDATDSSQPPQKTQTQPDPIVMECCGKTLASMRDCNCLVPKGPRPCRAPPLVFTHFRRDCTCFSCEWLRETKEPMIQDWSSRRSGGNTVHNPKYDAENKFDVDQDTPGSDTNLELVYGIKMEERRWEWVFYPVNQTHLPFLADPSEHSGVLRVTLGSNGEWKGLKSDGTSFPLRYRTRPALNELYPDYGYAPECSPVSIYPGLLCISF